MAKTLVVVLWFALMLGMGVAVPASSQTAGQPSAAESTLFTTAQKSGTAADYRAYLAQYPNGVFAEIAQFELEWAAKSTGTSVQTSAAPETTIAPPTDEAGTSSAAVTGPQTDILFETPLIAPGTIVDGKAIAELIQGSPLFPPIEGIPESLWKDKTCSNCHNWTKEALCTQGGTYSQSQGEAALTKNHPYGGAFKAALKTFAIEGCR